MVGETHIRKALAVAVPTALLALAVGSGTAYGASTRAEYVAQVDPICEAAQIQEGFAASSLAPAVKRAKAHKGSRRARRKLNRAVRGFILQVIAIERGANAQIATVPPAPDDVGLIQVWLRARGELLDQDERLFLGGVKQNKGLKGLGQALNDLFEGIGREFEVTDLVRDFGFQFCNRPPDAGIG